MPDISQSFRDAIAQHQAGRFAEAEQNYLQVVAADKRHFDALRLLGGLYLQTNRNDRAAEFLERAVKLNPKDAEILNNLGVALRGMGKPDEAAARYEEALRLQPNYAQALNNLGSIYLENGRPEKAAELIKKSLQLDIDNAQSHFNMGNALRELRHYEESLKAYEYALRLQPNYSDAATNMGLSLGELGRKQEALAWHEKAVQLDTLNHRALNNLGNTLRESGKAEEAITYFLRALQAKADYEIAHINLGTVYRDLGKFDLTAEQYDKALQLKPDSADALINYGTLMLDLNRHEDALERYDAALKIKPTSSDAQWSKAITLLALGDYEEGWRLHEAGFGNPRARGIIPYKTPTWHGESLEGKRLLLWPEQGLGDSLQFIRYAELCKQRGAAVISLCPAPLTRLFKTCPFIDEVTEGPVADSAYDYQISLMSLPHVFGTRLETIPSGPYLLVDEATRTKWAPRFAEKRKPRVGLVWSGSPREHQHNAHMIDKRRSMSLAMLKPLFDFGGIDFYNLQLGKAREQIAECGLQDRIIDYMGDVRDFLDTAGIVENLDLVISVDTSVVHLAGGLGKPVWVLSRFDACWRWLRNRETSPWYPSARVFGQDAPGAWQPVVDAVTAALGRFPDNASV